MQKIVIVMPSYNEAKNISMMITELVDKEFKKIEGAQMHLLVVDGNSPDGTSDLVKKAQKTRKNLHLFVEPEKRGLGMAYISGFKYAIDKLGADAVMEMDADGQHPPRFVKSMVEAYLGGADYVIGSRYIKGGSVPAEWAASRKAISFFGNLFIRLVLVKPGIHDLTTGFRLTKVKGVLDKIDLDNLMELKRFAYKVDLLYQSMKNAKKVQEVPLEFAQRMAEKSKFNSKEMIATFKVAIILGIKDKAKFIKFATVGFTGFVVNSVFLILFPKLGFAEILAWALSTELAIISNFTLNNIWTFKADQILGLKKTIAKFVQFNLSSSLAIIVQSILGTLAVSLFGPSYRIIYLFVIVIFVVMPMNYFIYNKFIWKRKKNQKQ